MEEKTYLKIVCVDIDGKNDDIAICRMPIEKSEGAFLICEGIRMFDGKCRIEFEDFVE